MSRDAIYDAVLNAADYLRAWGFELPDDLKTRDTREPGRREKMQAEDKLAAILLRYWRKQARIVKERLEMYAPDRKAIAPPFDRIIDDAFDEEDIDELIANLSRVLNSAAWHGINLFEMAVPIGMDYSLVNSRAAEWARKYTYDLIKEIGDTSRRILQDVIGAFVETPGMTIGDVMAQLPFDEQRARTVATTEITRAYAEAHQIAGRELQREFPDVKVIKTWYTNNDDLVCPICAPLDGMEVEMGDGFSTEEGEGLEGPPAHPNCRCWMETTTALAELGEEEAAPASAEQAPAGALNWQPSMTQEDADRWAQGSAMQDSVYHVTSATGARAIQQEGFDLSQQKFGRLWGDGVYVTESPEVARMYQEWMRQSAKQPEMLQIKINVDRVYTIDLTDEFKKEAWMRNKPESFQINAIKDVYKGEDWYNLYDRFRDENPSYDLRSEGSIWGELMHRAGYDAVHIIVPEAEPLYGGSQWVIFDPQDVTVIK